MKPKAMLKIPVEERRGAVTQEAGSFAYVLVEESPDRVLDLLLQHKVIGAVRRDCLKEIRANAVVRPTGAWGVLVRLKGQKWTYVLGDTMKFEWPQQWAAEFGWRAALFSLDGMINTKVAKLYDGPREVFNFVCGLIQEPEAVFLFRKLDALDGAIIRGEGEACSQAWLDALKSGGQAMDLLARLADAYLPVALRKRDQKGKVSVSGWDGEPYPEGDGDTEPLPEAIFERVDLFTYGGPEALEPSAAALALTAVVRAGDAAAAEKALAEGADPNVMCDDEESPLLVALGLGSSGLFHKRFSKITREQLLALLSVLLKAGANPDLQGESAIHRALDCSNRGDEPTILGQLRLLLDHKADPNAMATFPFSNGLMPLHVVVRSDQWLGVLKLLVQRGADPKLTNHQGKTPLEMARERLAELQQSTAEVLSSGTPGSADGNSGGSGFLAALMAEGEQDRQKAMKSLMGDFFRAASAEEQGAMKRLQAVVAFLEAAEQGTADFSDVDALAAASADALGKAAREEEARSKEKISALEEKMKKLTADLRKSLGD